MTTTCPVCARNFRDAHGRGGHLATYNDAAHDAFRLQHGIKHPLGPDGKPTVVGARWRGPDPPPPTPPAAQVPEVDVEPVPAPSAVAVSEQAPQDAQPKAGPLPNRPPAPAPVPAPATDEPAASAPREATAPVHAGSVWIPLGISVGGLAALVLANKGKNAPKPVPTQAAPSADPFPGIWTQPDPVQSTGFPYVDKMLGYSGLPATRRRLWP